MDIKLAGVVVLFNPSEDVVHNINSYINYIDCLYIIDNSPSNDFMGKMQHINQNEKINYLFLNGNNGVGPAINIGARLADEHGYEWLLTMDQDSRFNNVIEMINYIKNDRQSHLVGIYSPFHDTGTRVRAKEDITYEKTLMTSGNIINLNIYFKVGGTDEIFFIDCADHDLCLTINEAGYFVKRLNFCTLKHALGNDIVIINGKEITNHSPFRRYYMTRNTLYLVEKHIFKSTRYSLKYFRSFLGNTLSCFLYEDQKIKKLGYISLGFIHYILRKKGSF